MFDSSIFVKKCVLKKWCVTKVAHCILIICRTLQSNTPRSRICVTANPGRDPYKQLWKFLPNLLIIFQYFFLIQWWIGKLILYLWRNLRADFIYLHLNLHQWLVYKTSVISTSHVTIQGTCWKWKYLSRFYCEEIMNIDFDEEANKIISQIFKGVINLP